MNYAARGIYRDLLDECWIAGYIVNDPYVLAKDCGVPQGTFDRAWKQLRPMFIEVQNSDGHFLTSERLEVERNAEDRARAQRVLAGLASAAKRNGRSTPVDVRSLVGVGERERVGEGTAVDAGPPGSGQLAVHVRDLIDRGVKPSRLTSDDAS